jgi:hypothetical protein
VLVEHATYSAGPVAKPRPDYLSLSEAVGRALTVLAGGEPSVALAEAAAIRATESARLVKANMLPSSVRLRQRTCWASHSTAPGAAFSGWQSRKAARVSRALT